MLSLYSLSFLFIYSWQIFAVLSKDSMESLEKKELLLMYVDEVNF